jgi:hypothetical protein
MRNRPLGIYEEGKTEYFNQFFCQQQKSQNSQFSSTNYLAPPSKLFVSNASSVFLTGIQIAYISWRSKNFNK